MRLPSYLNAECVPHTDCCDLSDCPCDPEAGARRLCEVGAVSGECGHRDVVLSSCFAPSGYTLVTGCLGGRVVWHQPVLGLFFFFLVWRKKKQKLCYGSFIIIIIYCSSNFFSLSFLKHCISALDHAHRVAAF